MIFLRTLLGNGNVEFSVNCLKTCIENCMQETKLEIFEDGTLTAESSNYILTQIPNAEIVWKSKRDLELNVILSKYPNSNAFRKNNVFGYKFFDVMLYDKKPFYYLDSDIIFFRKFYFPEPGENPIFMMDSESSYCFSLKKTNALKSKVCKKINAGFYYFPETSFNLSIIENLLIDNYDQSIYSHSWAEQTLWSMVVALQKTAYYFKPNQILMASPYISINKNLIAIHFSKPYRNKISRVKNSFKKRNYISQPQQIELKYCKPGISFIPFVLFKFYNKILRKIFNN